MKLPVFESLDEKMKSMANEVFPPLHPAWSGETNQAYQDGFEAGVIERDKQWQSKVSKLIEALDEIKTSEGVWKSRYVKSELTVEDLKYMVNSALAEFYGEEK